MAAPKLIRSGGSPLWRGLLALLALVFASLACNFPGGGGSVEPTTPTAEAPEYIFARPTRSPTATPQLPDPEEPTSVPELSVPPPVDTDSPPILYYTQAGDTLPAVAVRFGVFPEEITSPDELPAEMLLNPGQLLIIPDRIDDTTSPTHVLPDSEVVYSPSAIDFDVPAFVAEAGGRLNRYDEFLGKSGTVRGGELIHRVALDNSINPMLLLTLLEYQGGWVYGEPATANQEQYPFGNIDPSLSGLYKQLVWTVNQLSIGYYGWREGRLTELNFPDGSTRRLAPDLNAGTVALQYLLSKLYTPEQMEALLDPDQGLPALYKQMFGDPWLRAELVEPLYPPDLAQPELILPFLRNQLWAFSGGPHGAWEHDGAWAALDFAPGSSAPGCEVSYSWVTAVGAGLVTRSERGVVVVDMDGDGYEQTGWAIFYLHIAETGRVPVGTLVEQGDRLGYPSCEGGIATGTHVHIARKYNGEWIPADGPLPFVLGGWRAHAGSAAYKGTLTRDDEIVTASDLGIQAANITRRDSDP
jgi:LasA protease